MTEGFPISCTNLGRGKGAKSPGLVFVSPGWARAQRMWFSGQRIRQQMKKKKNSFDFIQLGSVLAPPAAIGKSQQRKPSTQLLQHPRLLLSHPNPTPAPTPHPARSAQP